MQRTTPPLICSFHIILYTCKVVNANQMRFPCRNAMENKA